MNEHALKAALEVLDELGMVPQIHDADGRDKAYSDETLVEAAETIFRAALEPATQELREALEMAQEHFKHAPHTRTGTGGVTEHDPKHCTKCRIEAVLAKYPAKEE